MLAWSKAPWWEGLSRHTGGPHSAKHTVEKSTLEKSERGHVLASTHSLCLVEGVHFAVVHSRGGIGWSEMAGCKKPAFIPHYQTPLSINLSKLSFTTNYRCQLERFVPNLPGSKPGIFFFFGEFNQRLFLFGSIKSFWLKMTIFKENVGIPMKWMVWFIWNEMTSSKSQSWFYVALYKGKKTLPAGFSWEM